MALEDAGVVFSDLSGQVEARPGDDEEAWEFAKIDRKLFTDDHIKTGLDSSAILSFADMSTFVMKPSTEIILSSPTKKESKIKLACGNIWVNVKKMVKDGTMDIEMSQAVAGIKGTNITCQTNPDGTEDRIQVLRGMADILIKESREHVSLQEGEELIVKSGGKAEKVEINIQEEMKKWDAELSKMGETIQLDEVPDTLRQIHESESSLMKGIQDEFKTLVSGKVEEKDVQEFRKNAERFSGVLMEDRLIIAAIGSKIDKAFASNPSPSILAQLQSYQKMVADSRKRTEQYAGETAKMLKYQFKTAAVETSPEVEQIQAEFAEISQEVDSVLTELAANPSGLSQDWFAASL
ncbi:MAG TPA: FecR domain-containing protein, partial [Candidatus Ozemobacteraceae bacterium]|nr:FecR domain-containing protein [Candidatus Ozemobacteraceae bacterium]